MIREKLTQEHIDKGIKGDACKCPVALFFSSEFNTNRVYVDVWEETKLIIVVDEKLIQVKNPEKLIKFIKGFDSDGDKSSYVKPMFIEYEP